MTLTSSTRQQLRQRAAERGVSVDTYLQYLLRLDEVMPPSETTHPPEPSIRLRAQDTVPAGITLADMRLPDVPLVYANQAFLEITGYSPDEVIGRNCRFMNTGDSDQDALDEVRQAIQTGTSCKVLLRNYRKDGTMFWNELTLAPMHDDSGELTHFVGIQMDVTERVQLQKHLLKREQHLQALFQNNPLPMWAYDLDTLAILDVNEAAITQYGYSREDFLSMTIADIRPESEVTRLQASLQQNRTRYQQSGVWTHQRKDGTLLDVEITSHVIDFQDKQAALVVALDVTDRLEAERQLARSEKRYRMVSELSFDYAFSLRILDDGSTEKEWVTDAFQQVTGYTPDESEARGGWQTLIHSDDYDHAMQVLKRTIRTGEGSSLDYRIITKSGEVRHIHGEHIPEHDPDSGQVIRIYGVAHDITEQHNALQQLRRSEERFRTLVQSVNDIVYTLDLAHRHTGVFGSWVEETGMTAADFIGKTARDLMPKETASTHIQANERAYQGESVSYEWSILQDDTRTYYQTNVSPLRDDTGEIFGLVGVGRDITDRVQAIEELEFKTRLWSTITQLQREFIAQTDTVSLFTDILNKLLDLTDSEYGFIGELAHDSDGTAYLQAHALTDISWNETTKSYYDAHLPTGFQFRNMDTLFGYTMKTEAPLITSDPAAHAHSSGLPPGHPELHHYMGLPIMRGGKIVGMAGVANRPGGYDESMPDMLRPYLTAAANLIEAHHSEIERRTIQNDLRHSEERFRRILEAASEGILLVSMDGDILLANEQASAIFGYDRQTLTTRSALEILPLTTVDLHPGQNASGKIRRVGDKINLHARRADGTRFPIQINLSYLEEDNGEVRALCLIEDITVRKQLEAQRIYTKTLQIELEKERELMELKQRFISMISHEFRTPLTVMMSSSQILERYHERLTRDRFLKHVKSFRPQIERMTHMLDEVLLVNKADANLLEFNPRPVMLHDLFRALTEQARLIDDYQHKITLQIAADVPAQINADPSLLEHMLMNLLSNATKYSPKEKPIMLDVQQDSATDELVIHVKDEGMGIPLDDQKRLFQPFHRAKNAQNINGTGLGLAIVQNSAELHEGCVTFTSRVEEGSIFTLRLPLQPVKASAPGNNDDTRPLMTSEEVESDR